jgi:hypothetical protein
VSRTLRRVACLLLLAVLSGAPAVAVICAEICTPSRAAETTSKGRPCHGPSALVPTVSSERDSHGQDHTVAIVPAIALLGTGRGPELAAAPPAESHGAHHVGVAPIARLAALPADETPPPRPAPSGLVLRI